ncbi:MAG TPA: tRNA (adenosine(37)-N6)-dimethylallyltransferase MiaA [Kofleriaceae bacterium]|nr:tRNA (adenosine(37)-N6)-dimethylallyltransferase MiaA [Kofleriaceae bacterium]
MDAPRLVIIVGPTGAGKSGLAMTLAEAIGGEIVSADSQQVYRGMDIGTGKASAAERARVPHHLLDVLEPDQLMTARRFTELADAAIADLAARGRPVIVAGGTGLYVRALLLGIFEGPPADPVVRARLAAEARAGGGPLVLWERLGALDPAAAARIDRNDLIRITRALEVHELTGVTMTEHQQRHDHRRVPPRYPARLIGLAPPRPLLYAAIEARVDRMIEAGLVDEVRALRAAGYAPPVRSQAAIGYAELHQMLEGTCDLPRAIDLIKRNSRRYARRQLSWYRRDQQVQWFEQHADVDVLSLGRYLRQPD